MRGFLPGRRIHTLTLQHNYACVQKKFLSEIF